MQIKHNNVKIIIYYIFSTFYQCVVSRFRPPGDSRLPLFPLPPPITFLPGSRPLSPSTLLLHSFKIFYSPPTLIFPLLFCEIPTSHFLFILLLHILCGILSNPASREQSNPTSRTVFLMKSWIQKIPSRP